ncbi:MAG TPA: hypothetical protein VMR37_02015, partial [Rhabdochlamydiaceae bacterium]|nr:hypothetical protein [Rhabdochlamydiaceae bacterium]
MPLENITNASSLQMKQTTNPKVISDDAVVVSETFIQSICEFLVDLQETLADFFLHRNVKKIDRNPKTSKQQKEIQKALDKTLSILGNLKKKVRNDQRKEMIAIHHKVLQKPISVLEKIKSFVTLPEDLVPYIDIFFA